jgi:uncharacterized repeat protein (TIGR03806 family)
MKSALRRVLEACAAVLLVGEPLHPSFAALPNSQSTPYGLNDRMEAHPYLRMPASPNGKIPPLLSQTGAFKDTPHMVPSDGLIPYDLVVPFWSDGAEKHRWISVPKGKIKFSPAGEWSFPEGTVFVKTFELPTDAQDLSVKRRLETRLLMCGSGGAVYGVVYKWRPDLSDADLLPDGLKENIPIRGAQGEIHQQTWDYPSRKDCLTCHTVSAGGVLGVKTRQMNHDFTYPSGITDNELRAWNHIALFEPGFRDDDVRTFPRLAPSDDASLSLADRARSYLDANCSQCHRPGGTVADFDARYDTPPAKQELVDGPVLIDQGIDRPRIISPHDIWRSILYMRINTVGDIRMPPLDRETIDVKGVDLMHQWIESLPGRPVLGPPSIEPAGGTYAKPVEISLANTEPGADIRYTLDGSVPGPSDTQYKKPFMLSQPAVVRTRAFKDGFTKSITSQEVFVVGK